MRTRTGGRERAGAGAGAAAEAGGGRDRDHPCPGTRQQLLEQLHRSCRVSVLKISYFQGIDVGGKIMICSQVIKWRVAQSCEDNDDNDAVIVILNH